MGFTKPPNQLYDKLLFINNCQGAPWSWPNNIPCHEVALEGVPIGLVFRTSQYKEDVSEKLLFLLQDTEANEIYCLRFGLETVFSRGLLLGLRACLKSPETPCKLIISPKISERDGKVIFCNLWADGQRVKAEWDKDVNLYSLARTLAEKFFPQLPFTSGKDDSTHEVTEVSKVPDSPTGEVSFESLIVKNNADLKFLGITPDQGKEILLSRYGKKSRQLLSDEELLDFVGHIDTLVRNKTQKDIPF